MTNKNIVTIFISVIIGFSLIISIPVVILSAGFSPYVTIEDSPDPFIYNSQNSSGIHKLNLNVDVGDVKIQYTTALYIFICKSFYFYSG